MNDSLSGSYIPYRQLKERVKVGILAVVIFIAFWAVFGASPIIVGSSVLIGVYVGYNTESLRDSVLNTGVGTGFALMLLLSAPIITAFLSVVFGFVPTIALEKAGQQTIILMYLSPIILILSMISALVCWYGNWFVEMRHGSIRDIFYGNKHPLDPFNNKTPRTSLRVRLVIITSLLVIAVLIALVFVGPTLQPQGQVKINETGESILTTNESAEIYAGVTIREVTQENSQTVTVFIYSMGNAERITVHNLHSETEQRITQSGQQIVLSDVDDGDVIVVSASKSGITKEIEKHTVGQE